MTDTRKGFLTSEQEKQTDGLIQLSGVWEKLDGPAITLADNQGLERAKTKLVEKYGEEILEDVYQVVDAIFEMLPTAVE